MQAKKLYEAPRIESTKLYKRVEYGKGFLITIPCENCLHTSCSAKTCDCFLCRLYDDTEVSWD